VEHGSDQDIAWHKRADGSECDTHSLSPDQRAIVPREFSLAPTVDVTEETVHRGRIVENEGHVRLLSRTAAVGQLRG
jgi:hypothetical protein